jgi:hypothetical protein
MVQGERLISEYPPVSGFPQVPEKKSWEKGPSMIQNCIPVRIDSPFFDCFDDVLSVSI